MTDAEQQELIEVYTKTLLGEMEKFKPGVMLVPSDEGPVWIFPDGTGIQVDDEGNRTRDITWEWNPEWLKEI